ncbi:MAG: hypothetical protein RLZZ74_1563 [Cyanobacteriota bacterium]|jgi:hypothetical protein
MKKNIKLLSIFCLFSNFVFAETENSQIMEVIPDQLSYLYTNPQTSSTPVTQNQLSAVNRRWENNRHLRVCFFNANPVVVELIRTIASEWNNYSGISLDFGKPGTWFNCLSPQAGFPEIRIGFSERGYWSYVGSDAERHGGERSPSMNFDSFNTIYTENKFSTSNILNLSDNYHKAVIRHEFGHALGLLHEHQNPTLNCKDQINWVGENSVYAYFSKYPNYWSKEQVDRNIGFVGLTDPDYISGEADPKSIMMYSLSPSIFKDGLKSKCATPINYEISEKDKSIITKLYPKNNSTPTNSIVNESVDASYVKPVPVFINNIEANDFVDRVLIDIESDDTATRRNARSRLAQILVRSKNIDSNIASDVISKIDHASYRYQLGIAVSLRAASQKIEISSEASEILRKKSNNAIDNTLKSALKSAQKNISIIKQQF